MTSNKPESSAEEPWKDKERMIDLYENQGYTYAEMADLFGCSDGTVSNWMKKHKADELRNGLDVDIPDDEPHKDAELMKTLYVNKELSQSDISAIIEKSTGCVRDWLVKHGIKTRSISEGISKARGGSKGLYYFTNKAYGYEVFKSGRVDSFYHHRLIAVAVHGFKAVKDKHVHHVDGVEWHNCESNLELINPGEHMRHHHGNYNWLDEIRAVEMYDEGASSYDIAKVIGCAPETALAWVHKNAPELVREPGAT